MSRLKLQTIENATGKTRELLETVKGKFGAVPNILALMANAPAALEAYLQMSGALAAGTLAPALRERIALAVAEANECGYCLSAHGTIAKGVGLTDEEITAARRGIAADPKERALLAFALSIVRERGDVAPAELEAVRRAGATDGEIAETVANVALNLYTNYFNHVADTEIDFPRVNPGEFPKAASGCGHGCCCG